MLSKHVTEFFFYRWKAECPFLSCCKYDDWTNALEKQKRREKERERESVCPKDRGKVFSLLTLPTRPNRGGPLGSPEKTPMP